MYFRHCLIYFYSFSSTEIKLKSMLRLKTIVQLIKLTECRFTSIGVKDAFFFFFFLLNKIKIISVCVCECGQVSKTECMFNSVWLIADRKFSC